MHQRLRQPSTPDDHSPLAPPLPIPNRTVKRRRADDSTDYPCESRSLSGTLHAEGPITNRAFCIFGTPPVRAARRSLLLGWKCAVQGHRSHTLGVTARTPAAVSDPPCLDLRYSRPQVVGDGVDGDADSVGRVGRERDRALDKVVATGAAEGHPRRSIPSLDAE